MKKYFFLLFLIFFLLNSCDNNKISNIEVKIRSREENTMEFKTILLNIYGNTLTYLYKKPMIKIDDKWSIILPSLPLGEKLTFKAVAFNSDNNLIYQATKISTLTNDIKIINLGLEYVDDCNCSFFGAEVDNIKDYGEYATVRFNIYNYLENRLDYRLYSENGYIFTPQNSIIDSYDNNYTHILDVNYTKPYNKGRFVNFLYLNSIDFNKQSKLEFDLMIDRYGKIQLVENMPPKIVNLDINKNYDTVSIFANVIDDENSRINYLWEVIDGDLEIVGSNKMREVLFKNYIMGTGSQISIKVTDKRGFSSQEIYLID